MWHSIEISCLSYCNTRRYRESFFAIAILADIEKAFLQIGVQEHDRDVTRFLWYTDPTKPEKIEGNLSVYRFCRVPFGIICSPFLLEGTLRFHLKKEGSSIAKLINDKIMFVLELTQLKKVYSFIKK